MFRILGIVLAIAICTSEGQAQTPAKKPITFNRDIRPILSDNCFLCHGPAKATRKADLRIDLEEDAREDRGGYAAIVPGKPEQSHLYLRLIEKEPAKMMPPKSSHKKMTPAQIELIRQWIEQGAKYERHWAFLPVERPPVPEVKNKAWAKNPIDRFLLARLEEAGMTPSPEASKEALLRRVTFDLTGLPPTLAEIEAFQTDTSPDAYEKVVDRLLASHRYGERMVLEWLDAARYSDTNGYQTDGTRAMWPWRDWVIKAINDNMPFDQFTIEQIAGDLLPSPTVEQKIATGFHRNHMLNGEGGRIAEESRVEYVWDRVETTGTVWLGLTANCSRCHDHKYDPLSQKEYYQLYAYFNSINEVGGVDRRNGTAAPTIELPTPEQAKKIDEQAKKVAGLETSLKKVTDDLIKKLPEWEKSIKHDKLPMPVVEALKIESVKRNADQKKAINEFFLGQSPEYKKLSGETEAAKKSLTGLKNSVLITMVMEERKEPRETAILIRGIYDKYGEKVKPALPAALPLMPKGEPNNRLGLARWLVDRGNPLTSRVTVNRFWQTFFGIGIVKTTEDFGAQAEPPTHPQLLDWLAAEFMDPTVGPIPPTKGWGKGWNMRHIQRLIVTSAAYRQSSKVSSQNLEKDPDNRLLARFPRLRHAPFALRDQALMLAGLLVEKVGGPPVRPYQPPGLWEDFSFNQIRYTQDKGENLYRRSLYTFWRRSIAPPNLFDTPSRQVCTVRASRTNTPLHALILLNDVTFVEASRVWAEKLMREAKSPEDRLSLAFRQATSRPARDSELKILLSAYDRTLKKYQTDRPAAEKLVGTGEWPRPKDLDVIEHATLTAVLNVMMNLDEVVTRE